MDSRLSLQGKKREGIGAGRTDEQADGSGVEGGSGSEEGFHPRGFEAHLERVYPSDESRGPHP